MGVTRKAHHAEQGAEVVHDGDEVVGTGDGGSDERANPERCEEDDAFECIDDDDVMQKRRHDEVRMR